MTGDYPLEIGQVWRTLLGGGERVENYVVLQVRLPRLRWRSWWAMPRHRRRAPAGPSAQPAGSPDLLGITRGQQRRGGFPRS